MDIKNSAKGLDAKWYFTIVQNPGSCSEQMVGFRDAKTDEKFLPAFKSKEAAQTCFSLMPKNSLMGDYDCQAVIREDLISYAKDAGHKVYLMDEKGTILDYLEP